MNALYILTGLGVIAMLAEIFGFKKLLLPITLLGLVAAAVMVYVDRNAMANPLFSKMLQFDRYAQLFTLVLLGTTFLWLLMSQDFFSSESSRTDHYALALFSVCGGILMVSYSNMLMLFLGIEILSIPVYVLAGSRKDNISSNESALKYFLMGAFATGFLLFGIALIYGACGTFSLADLATYLNSPESFSTWRGESGHTLMIAGILMMLIGMSFKVAAVPFHFWTPDVYEGAPSSVTAFMSTIVKTAAFAAFLRLFMTCFSSPEYGIVWNNIVWTMAALSILLGNITAVYQTGVKRMLAYSSIAHAGYMMLAILTSGGPMSAGAVLYYSAAYSIASIGAFTVLTILERNGVHVTFDNFNGLAKKNPLLAFGMTISMLSLAGIPPLAGFFGKYYLFAAALKSGFVLLVLLAALGSLIGVYYYLRAVIAMYSKEPANDTTPIEVSMLQKVTLLLTILGTVVLGALPYFVIRLI